MNPLLIGLFINIIIYNEANYFVESITDGIVLGSISYDFLSLSLFLSELHLLALMQAYQYLSGSIFLKVTCLLIYLMACLWCELS